MKILIVDNVRSLHNIGAFFRTCECLGIDQIYLCGNVATPPRKEITKTALGAEDIIEWTYFETTQEAIVHARSLGCDILGLELSDRSITLESYSSRKDWALVVGHEIMGVEKEIMNLCDEVLEISMQGEKQSLNVSVATGIALYQLSL